MKIFSFLIIIAECVLIVALFKDKNIMAILGWIIALVWTINYILLEVKK